jgi:IS1 family transposase
MDSPKPSGGVGFGIPHISKWGNVASAKDIFVFHRAAKVKKELTVSHILHARLIRTRFVIPPGKRAGIDMPPPIGPDPWQMLQQFCSGDFRWHERRAEFEFGIQPKVEGAGRPNIPHAKPDLPKCLSNGQFIGHYFDYNPSSLFLVRIPDLLPYGFHRGLGGNSAVFSGFSRIQSDSRCLSGGFPCVARLTLHRVSLSPNGEQSKPSNKCIDYRDIYDDPFRSLEPRQRFLWGFGLTLVGFWLGAIREGKRWINNHMRWWDWLFGLIGFTACCMGSTLLIFGHAWPPKQERCEHSYNRQIFQHNTKNVSQKLSTLNSFRITLNTARQDMANVLGTDKKIAVVAALAEGSSIRSIERMTGIHRDTIMRLGVRVGQGCTILMHEKMRDLPCSRLEVDEIWGFVGKKDRNVNPGKEGVGNVWTFCVIDADTKLVPAFKVGDRCEDGNRLHAKRGHAMRNRVQISTDGLKAYVDAVEKSFGADVDYAQIVKTYGHEEASNNRRYSAPDFVSSEKRVIVGRPNYDLISTSYVERLNATTRLHMRRLTRLTLAFSKKRENFDAAGGLHFAYYNFVKRHNTIRCTPAMAAGVASTFWSVGDLVEAAA